MTRGDDPHERFSTLFSQRIQSELRLSEQPPGGHDLVLDHTTGLLFLSDLERLWTFDRTERAFSPFAPLPVVDDVKSITRLGPRGPFLLVQATESWWSDRGRAVGDEGVAFRVEGARFYKLRAWP